MMDLSDERLLALFGATAAGMLTGIGQLLNSDSPVTLRNALGRALVSGVLALAAPAIWLVWPDASPHAVVGLGAALASLGTSGIERLLQRYTKG